MPDLRTVLRDAAASPAAELDYPSTLHRGRRLRRQRRRTALASVLVTFTVTAALAAVVRDDPTPPRPALTGLEDIPVGWSDLPPPPDGLFGGAVAWTGQELLVWSGDDISQPGDGGTPSDQGFAFDPRTSTWRTLPTAPIVERDFTASAWTGRELLVWGGAGRPHTLRLADGALYNPGTDSWRRMRAAPTDFFLRISVWTGQELLVWGDSAATSGAPYVGAAYDPAADTWRRIASTPGAFTAAAFTGAALPTGEEVVAIGGLGGGSAAYDVDADTWVDLGPVGLSTPVVAATVFAVDGHVVAWDYEHATAALDGDRWRPGPTAPLRRSECFPAATSVGSSALGQFCGQSVLYDGGSGTWRDVSDWRNSTLSLTGVAAGDVVLLVGGDITDGGAGRLRAFRPGPVTSQECATTPFDSFPSQREAAGIVAVGTTCGTAERVARDSETAVGASYRAAGFDCPAAAKAVEPDRFIYQCTSEEAIVKFASLPYPLPEGPPVPSDARIAAPRPLRLEATDDFGRVVAVRAAAAGWEIDVDRVAMLGGEEAEAAALAHGERVETDYYLVNDDPTVRTYTVAADCVVWGNIALGHPGEPNRVTLTDWRAFLGSETGKSTLFHFDLNGTSVTGVEEQYRP